MEKRFSPLEFPQFFSIVAYPPFNSIFYIFIILVFFFSLMFDGGYETIEEN
jgi:hypothetical protein